MERKNVFITGGSRGIGKAIAKKFAQNGYDVIVNYVSENINLEELEKVANRFIFLHNQRIIFDGSLAEMGKQLKKVQVTFNSELIKDIFNKLPAVLRVSELNHHYTLITSDVNSLITQLVPYLSAIDNLEIRQQNLDTLMDSLIRNEE